MAKALNPSYTAINLVPMPKLHYSGALPGPTGIIMKTLFILLLSCLLGVATADAIYKWVDDQGNVHYSDEPGDGGAKKMNQLPGLSTYAPEPIKIEPEKQQSKPPDKTMAPEEAAEAYRSMSIVKPEDGETVRSNPGIVEVFIALAPPLGENDHIRVALDGKPLPGKYTKAVLQLENVDRGEHQLSVAVHDSKGKKLIGSATHTFYLHKASVINRSPKS